MCVCVCVCVLVVTTQTQVMASQEVPLLLLTVTHDLNWGKDDIQCVSVLDPCTEDVKGHILWSLLH